MNSSPFTPAQVASPAPEAGPSSSKPAPTSGPPQQTDVKTLNDPLAAAGVDLAAEDENIRQLNLRRGAAYMPATGKSAAPMIFVNREDLQARVTSLAAQMSMKALKADTLDLISAAVQHRLRNLLDDILLARKHRLMATATRQPPMYDTDDLNDDDEELGLTPMWDIDTEPDVAKILNTMARVQRDEERRARRERAARDLQEQEEQEEEARAAVAAKLEEEERAAMKDVSTPDAANKAGPKKEKKRKRESAAAVAKNLPEEMQKKITDASARHTLFGGNQKFAWLQGGSGATTPKSTKKGNGASNAPSPMASTPRSTTGAPSSLLASSAVQNDYVPSTDIVWQDAMFALENERGQGAGKGTGQMSLYKLSALRRPES